MRVQQWLAVGLIGCNALAQNSASSLDEAMNASGNANETRFTGSPITLKLKDADVADVFRMISETSGFNIVIHPDVKGTITLSLEEVPWDHALNVVLTTLKLGAERKDNVMRILPKEMLMTEKRQDLETKRLAESSAPRVTRIFPISYADLGEISGVVSKFCDDNNLTGAAPVTVITDKASQSLIVRDTAERLEKIAKLIELVDVQTPQVMIEAKVLEATEQFSKDLGGSLGVGGSKMGMGFNGPQDLAGTSILLPSSANPAAGAFAGLTSGLNATLRMAESENSVKVISNPKTVVLSGKTASINQAQTIAKTLVTPATPTSPATSSIVQVTANTKLSVTPRVTNEGSVFLKLDPSLVTRGSVFLKLDLNRDVIHIETDGTPALEPRTMNTEVIVESGNTLVIGGVLNIDENEASGGMPFLRKIPLLGALFGSETYKNLKSELMFFVTPRILNQRKAISAEDTKRI